MSYLRRHGLIERIGTALTARVDALEELYRQEQAYLSLARLAAIIYSTGWWPAGTPAVVTAAAVMFLLGTLCAAACEIADLR